MVLFGLEDVLVPGKVEQKLPMEKVYALLQQLKSLEEKDSKFHMVLVTGCSEKEALKKIGEFKLNEYFRPENIHFVNQRYIESKEIVDQELYLKRVKENPSFKDEYFKQTIIQSCEKQFSCGKEGMVFIGHDVWTEGYYTMLFSGIDFVLIRSAHSHLDEKMAQELSCITYIDRDWKDVKKVIEGKIVPSKELGCLTKYAQKKLSEELFKGTQLEGLAKLSNAK